MSVSRQHSRRDTILVIKYAVFEELVLYIVYLLHCADSTLYCGITNDLEKRLREHNRGKGARYTRETAGKAGLPGGGGNKERGIEAGVGD